MNDIERVREGMGEGEAFGRDGERIAALDRIESALRTLTAEHGSQCQCQGCAVLREA